MWAIRFLQEKLADLLYDRTLRIAYSSKLYPVSLTLSTDTVLPTWTEISSGTSRSNFRGGSKFDHRKPSTELLRNKADSLPALAMRRSTDLKPSSLGSTSRLRARVRHELGELLVGYHALGREEPAGWFSVVPTPYSQGAASP